MVPQDKICTTGGYNSCPPHLNPSTTTLLSSFRVEQDFSHFILFLSSLLSRWASRHHKLQYAFYAASCCLWDPFLPWLRQAHTLSPGWVLQQLRLFKFNFTAQLQSHRERELDWTRGSRACGHSAAGHWPNWNATLWNAIGTKLNYWKWGLKESKVNQPSLTQKAIPVNHSWV